MPEKSQQGAPLPTLLEIDGLNKAKILSGNNELESRIVRTVTLLVVSPSLIAKKDGNQVEVRRALQKDGLVFLDVSAHLQVEDYVFLFERAADAGCAALILHADADFLVPFGVIEKANELGLPVLRLPVNVIPGELIAPLIDELLWREHALINQITSVQERMVNGILAGGGGQGIVDLLFKFIEQPILLVDEAGGILGQAGAWHRIPVWETLTNVEQLTPILVSMERRAGQWFSSSDFLEPISFGDTVLLFRPVLGGDEIKGWFILGMASEAIDLSARLALDQAAIAAALEIFHLSEMRQVEWRLQARLLDELFTGDKQSGTLDERAHRMGWDLRNKRAVMLVGWDEQEMMPQIRRQMVAAVTSYIRDWRPESVVLDRGSEILILPHLPEANDRQAVAVTLQNLANILVKDWPKHLKNSKIVIAIGGVQPSLKEIGISYQEACRVLELRKRLHLRNTVITFQDVRIFSLLERHLDDEESISLFQRTIGPLVEYDSKHQAELVRTAEVYYDCNYHLQPAADLLQIHPSSLKYRLQRIRNILGLDPFLDKDHLDYYLGTKLARLY